MKKKLTQEDIVNTAINLAENSSWEKVRLFDIAAALNIDLETIRHYFREKDEIIDAYSLVLINACYKVLPRQNTLHYPHKKNCISC